jgi:hypothetical protein
VRGSSFGKREAGGDVEAEGAFAQPGEQLGGAGAAAFVGAEAVRGELKPVPVSPDSEGLRSGHGRRGSPGNLGRWRRSG